MYGQHATQIVGYTFSADTYCPEHILAAVKATYPLDYPIASMILPEDTVEDILSAVAKSRRVMRMTSIDRDDETSFDSDEFPKVIFASDAWAQYESDHCTVCGVEIE